MNIRELVEKLQTFSDDAEVYFLESNVCDECNPEGFDFTHDISRVSFKEDTGYPNTEKNVVVIE